MNGFSKIINNLYETTDVEEEYNLLRGSLKLLNKSFDCGGKVAIELNKLPSYIQKSNELVLIAKTHLSDMSRAYELEYNKKYKELNSELSRKKKDGLIISQLTSSFIDKELKIRYETWYIKWDKNISDQKNIVEHLSNMYDCFMKKIQSLQSIGKHVNQRDNK